MPTRSQLDAALARYPEALSLRAKASKSSAELVELDDWYRSELRTTVRERRQQKRDEAHASSETPEWLSKDELSRLMQWKLARGKWRPRLQDMVATNSAEDVRVTTSRAATDSDHEAALKELSKLKAVGPATASAILALWYPDSEPFMSDEGLDYAAALGPGDEGKKPKRDYTVKAWRVYRDEMLERKEKEGWSSVDELEKAIWAWVVLRKYGAAAEEDDDGTATATATGGAAVKEEEEAALTIDANASRKSRKRGAHVEAVASQGKKRKST
ncbi:hypothetical protein JCM3774_003160 [Rhodotorula dairenensis]